MAKKKVLIVGDGPSVRLYFNEIKNMECDHIYCGHQILRKNFVEPSRRKVYYMIVEPRLFWPKWLLNNKRDHVKKMHNLSLTTYSRLKTRKDILKIFHLTNIPFLSLRKDVRFVFTRNFWRTIKINNTSGSYRACIALAVELGYNHIVMVGFDGFNQQKGRPNRWFEIDEPEIDNESAYIVAEQVNNYNNITFEIMTPFKLILEHERFIKSICVSTTNEFSLADVLEHDDFEELRLSGYYNMGSYE